MDETQPKDGKKEVEDEVERICVFAKLAQQSGSAAAPAEAIAILKPVARSGCQLSSGNFENEMTHLRLPRCNRLKLDTATGRRRHIMMRYLKADKSTNTDVATYRQRSFVCQHQVDLSTTVFGCH